MWSFGSLETKVLLTISHSSFQTRSDSQSSSEHWQHDEVISNHRVSEDELRDDELLLLLLLLIRPQKRRQGYEKANAY